jgi:hypothetical protein
MLIADRKAVSPHISLGGTKASSNETNVTGLIDALKSYIERFDI